MIDTTTPLCSCCRRKLTTTAVICQPCELEATRQLVDLPKLLRRLALCLMPGGGTKGGKVRSSKTAPLPLRLDPLTLIGDGSTYVADDVRWEILVWSETFSVLVDGDWVERRVWHRRFAWMTDRARDDQDGVLPIPTWLDLWEALVRRHFRDVEPAMPQPYRARVDPRAYTRATLYADRLAVGVDPLEVEMATRFGVVAGRTRTDDAADYLASRLPDICDLMPEAPDMLTELRDLYAAARAVAGEADDLVLVGRCPETLVDRYADVEQPCGARLWQDPFATVIRCPRCRTETGMAKWMWLARRIRDTWGEREDVAAA